MHYKSEQTYLRNEIKQIVDKHDAVLEYPHHCDTIYPDIYIHVYIKIYINTIYSCTNCKTMIGRLAVSISDNSIQLTFCVSQSSCHKTPDNDILTLSCDLNLNNVKNN